MTVVCNVVETLDQNMHHLYQNGTAHLIRVSSTNFPRDDFELRLYKVTDELDGVRQLMEGGGFNTVVEDFK